MHLAKFCTIIFITSVLITSNVTIYATKSYSICHHNGPVSSFFKKKFADHNRNIERIESLCGRLLDAVDVDDHMRALQLLARVVIVGANPTYAKYEDTGDNALHCAAKNNNTRLIESLLAAGANPLEKNNAGNRPYDLLHERYKRTRRLLDIAEQQQELNTYHDE